MKAEGRSLSELRQEWATAKVVARTAIQREEAARKAYHAAQRAAHVAATAPARGQS